MIGADGYLTLVDFGFAKRMTSDRTWTFCGSPDYLSPEVMANFDYMSDGLLESTIEIIYIWCFLHQNCIYCP